MDTLGQVFAKKIDEAETHNHHRAEHHVNWTPGGWNVQIPYKGYTLSLAAEGGDVWVWDTSNTILLTVIGTSGESIREVMDWIDQQKD